MSQLEAPGTTPRPDWLDLPDKDVYWVCTGYVRTLEKRPFWKRKPKATCGWTDLLYTAEDAEALAYEMTQNPDRPMDWDGKPARQIDLASAMREVRRLGRKGVRIVSYRDGAWRTVKTYPAGVPLRGEERES